jgi:hypothetical protein
VAELPPISVFWVEHRTRRLGCWECGAKTTAQLPAGIGGSAFGPNLQAALVTLTARNRILRRGMIELASDLFGVTVSTGTVDAICQRVSDALAGPHAQLQGWVLDQAAVHVDETGRRTAGDGRALWTLTTPDAALFQIAEHCNREQFQALIGPYPVIVISDRWVGLSTWIPTGAKYGGRTSSVTSAANIEGPPSRKSSASMASSSPAASFTHGGPTGTSIAIATGWRPRSPRSRHRSERCSSTPPRKASAPAGTGGSANNLLKAQPSRRFGGGFRHSRVRRLR